MVCLSDEEVCDRVSKYIRDADSTIQLDQSFYLKWIGFSSNHTNPKSELLGAFQSIVTSFPDFQLLYVCMEKIIEQNEQDQMVRN